MADVDELSKREDFVELVALERDELIAFWNAGHIPPANLKPGTPLWDLMATYSAEAQAVNRERVDIIRRQSSLYELVQNPDLATPEAVDRILSNYPARARRQGNYSKGYLAIYRKNNTIFTVPKFTNFRYGDLVYQTSMAYVATPGDLNNDFDRKLVELADGGWRVIVPVTAVEVGEVYDIKAGTELDWIWVENSKIDVLRVEAYSDFVGGTNPATNAELLEQQDSMIAAPGMAGRMNIEALLRNTFPEIIDISQIGGGDVEMQRDGRNILGLKVGGKTDTYVRTSYSVMKQEFELPAEVVDAGSGKLRMRIGRDVFPGFYMTTGVYRMDAVTDAEPLEITSLVYGKDTAGFPYDIPTMVNLVDYRYTRFQTMELEFTDLNFDPTKLIYRIELVGIPSIGEIQDFVAQRSVRSPNNDMLVKAAVPMFVAVNLTAKYQRSDVAIDEQKVVTAVRSAVNNTRFRQGSLGTATIACAAQAQLPQLAQVVIPVDILATLILPVSGPRNYRTTTELVPDTFPAESTSSRNVAFYCTDVYLSTQPINPKQV